ITSGGDTQPPTTPTGLTATPVSSSRIDLSWTASTDNIGVTGYRIERCQGASCTTFAQIAAPAGTATTYSDPGRTAATAYNYRVRAVDAAGNLSAYSNTAGATTGAVTYSVGGTVSGLSGTVVLQDNGGDDLSVTANGAFTFATRLANGAVY